MIAMYMIAGLSMMIFNFVFIYRSNRKRESMRKDYMKWKNEILSKPVRQAKFIKKMKHVENLIAFSIALWHVGNSFPERYRYYMRKRSIMFRKLAIIYGKKNIHERTYFAFFVSTYPQAISYGYPHTHNIMFKYLEDSNMYCRIFVIRAFCRIGKIGSVMSALNIINDKSIDINHLILADELIFYQGDKKVLAADLWSKFGVWNDVLMLAVVIFMEAVSNDCNEIFLPVLQDTSVGIEIRMVIARYYRKHEYEPVFPVLVDYINHPSGDNLAIVEAFALDVYPSQDTSTALSTALLGNDVQEQFNALSYLFSAEKTNKNLFRLLKASNLRGILDYVQNPLFDRSQMEMKKRKNYAFENLYNNRRYV